MNNMLDKITKSCKYVANNSKHVKINESKLTEFISTMKDIKTVHWLNYVPYNVLDLPVETIINFLLIYDSINFSFWGNPRWTIDTEIGKEDGSIALLYTMLKYVKENNSTDFSKMTKEEFAKILKGNVKIPLLEERYKIVKNISETVNRKMNGNFYEYIKDITDDVKLFNIIINNFPSLKDERKYKGEIIYLYKLAQLLVSDILHIRETKENIKLDYSHLVRM